MANAIATDTVKHKVILRKSLPISGKAYLNL